MQNIRVHQAFLFIYNSNINLLKTLLLFIAFCIAGTVAATAQAVTGIWKGKIGSARTEVKLVKKGDSLLGTSYYYTSAKAYRRYSVKGYFDPETNEVVWWDDALLEDNSRGGIDNALLAVADFNCPGENEMRLDGQTTARDNKNIVRGTVALQKTGGTSFPDEWDYVIDNYFVGANHPYIIDSIANLNRVAEPIPQEERHLAGTKVQPLEESGQVFAIKPPAEKKSPTITSPIVEKFANREKKLATVIPLTGDSVEIKFYDNAVVDGDSIAVFLNGNLLFEHVRLNYKPHIVKLAVDDLLEDNEMVMVAENLGTIPPNTSLMVVMIGDKRYEARLESTEQMSALIRFIKKK
jgi:hypothetical protein